MHQQEESGSEASRHPCLAHCAPLLLAFHPIPQKSLKVDAKRAAKKAAASAAAADDAREEYLAHAAHAVAGGAAFGGKGRGRAPALAGPVVTAAPMMVAAPQAAHGRNRNRGELLQRTLVAPPPQQQQHLPRAEHLTAFDLPSPAWSPGAPQAHQAHQGAPNAQYAQYAQFQQEPAPFHQVGTTTPLPSPPFIWSRWL